MLLLAFQLTRLIIEILEGTPNTSHSVVVGLVFAKIGADFVFLCGVHAMNVVVHRNALKNWKSAFVDPQASTTSSASTISTSEEDVAEEGSNLSPVKRITN